MIKERRPSTAPGSIHSPVALMKDIIARKDTKTIETMLRQLREAYADQSRSDYDKGGYLWLGKRYAAAYREITGVSPCK